MAEENLDFIVRLLFPDAKVPPIDTLEAQAAIAKLQALANNAPGPGNWSMGNGNWAQGPIRDPGSHASASLSTARGYDVGMLRQSLDGLQLDTYERGLQKLRMGMSQVRESTTGLAASVILLN